MLKFCGGWTCPNYIGTWEVTKFMEFQRQWSRTKVLEHGFYRNCDWQVPKTFCSRSCNIGSTALVSSKTKGRKKISQWTIQCDAITSQRCRLPWVSKIKCSYSNCRALNNEHRGIPHTSPLYFVSSLGSQNRSWTSCSNIVLVLWKFQMHSEFFDAWLIPWQSSLTKQQSSPAPFLLDTNLWTSSPWKVC